MSSARFTFINITGAPSLSPSADKRMRAHVTRTNFANRRQRMADVAEAKTERMADVAEAKTARTDSVEVRPSQNDQDLLAIGSSIKSSGAVNSSPMVGPRDSALLRKSTSLMAGITSNSKNEAVSSFWSCVFLDSSRYPSTSDEATWLGLLISEPALVESSLAVSLRHRVSWRERADVHACRAVNLLLQRIKSRQAHKDAVLAVVTTMAFGERLANNDLTWNIHMDGLAQLLKERHSQGSYDLPPWFTGLLISFVKSIHLAPAQYS